MKKSIYSVLILAIVLVSVSLTVNAQTPAPPVVPSVTTVSVTGISATSATYNGNVTASGGAAVTERGFQRSLSPLITAQTAIWGGTGTGVFSGSDTTLSCGTTYYFRAYARNSVGYKMGNVVSFTTQACATPTPTPTPTPHSNPITDCSYSYWCRSISYFG